MWQRKRTCNTFLSISLRAIANDKFYPLNHGEAPPVGHRSLAIHAAEHAQPLPNHDCWAILPVSKGLIGLMPSEVPTVRGNQSVEELKRELAEARA